MVDQPGESPKIFVDEDWKDRVEAEKRAAAEQKAAQQKSAEQHPAEQFPLERQPGAAASAAGAQQPSAGGAERPSTGDSGAASAGRHHIPPPPATLEFLITTLATQAMMALGQAINPVTGKAESHLPEAKHFIDMLTVLEEKTAGNRTPDESALLDGFLHELRMAYVMSQS